MPWGTTLALALIFPPTPVTPAVAAAPVDPGPVMPAASPVTATAVLTTPPGSLSPAVGGAACTPVSQYAVPNSWDGFVYAVAGGPTLPTFVLKPEMGFALVRPRWGKGPGVGVGPEDLDYGAVFIPRITFDVGYAPSPGAAPQTYTASASYLRLDGKLDRLTTLTGGSTREQADSRLELLLADAIGWKWLPRGCEGKTDPPWEVAVTVRYASVDQSFNSLATTGAAVVYNLSSTQKFSGFGVSVAAGARALLAGSWDDPGDTRRLLLYSSVRGSVLAGDNSRTSTLQATGSETVTIQKDERDVVPVGELEVGLAWGEVPLRLTRLAAEGASDPSPVIGVRAAALGQIWGNAGLISAARTPLSRFDSGNLYLYGAAVTFYLKQ